MKNRGNVISPQLFAAESLTHTGYYFKIGIVAPNYFGMTVPGFFRYDKKNENVFAPAFDDRNAERRMK